MKILIACGGTGGHIFPALSLYNALKKQRGNLDILLALDKRAASYMKPGQDYSYICLCLIPIRFNFNLQSPIIVLKLLKGIVQSLKILLKFRPDVVIGFGGYASFFIVFFSWIFRIRTLIHEPNVRPGRANRILAYFVDKIASGFAETKNYFGRNSFKVEFTGNPLKPNLVHIEKTRADKFLGLHPDRFTILVMGGSQGAQRINSVNLSAVSKIPDKSRFQIIHLSGRQDYSFLDKGYKDLGIKARVFSFWDAMQYAYSAADMVISRAGAATVNEIAFFGLPSILLPYPYVRRHQIENAQYLCQNNAAILIEEKDLNPDILKQRILELADNPDLRKTISQNVSMLQMHQADMFLADLVLNE